MGHVKNNRRVIATVFHRPKTQHVHNQIVIAKTRPALAKQDFVVAAFPNFANQILNLRRAHELWFFDIYNRIGGRDGCDQIGLPRQERWHLQDIADFSHWHGLGNFMHIRRNKHTECLFDLLQHLETLIEPRSAERMNGRAVGLIKRGFKNIGQAQFAGDLHEGFGHAHHQVAAFNHIHSTDQTHRLMIAQGHICDGDFSHSFGLLHISLACS